MFGKKKCGNCGKEVEKSFAFCPYCANDLKTSSAEDFGMLGEDDSFDPFGIRMPPTGFEKIFNSLFQSLEKEMRMPNIPQQNPLNSKTPNMKTGGLSISISSSGNSPPKIQIRKMGNLPMNQQNQEVKQANKNKIRKLEEFTESKLKSFAKMEKQEPQTNVRRLSNKIIYEILLPGIKSTKELSINQLENSIEIKALGKTKAYIKTIPITLPITDYKLSDEKLLLELGV